MNFETMETPITRQEFEHRFHLLENKIKNGKFFVSRDVSMESILKIRRLPNGRIDFLSVNESARLQANMILNMSKIDVPEDLGDTAPSP